MIVQLLEKIASVLLKGSGHRLVVTPPGINDSIAHDCQQGYLKHDNTLLPALYMRTCWTISIQADGYKGAVAIQQNRDRFRTAKLMPGELLATAPGDVEVNGLWIAKGVPRRVRVAFWLRFIALARDLGVNRIFFSWESRKVHLAPFWKLLGGVVLYSGPVPKLPGMRHAQVETVQVLHMTQLVQMLPWVAFRWFVFRK